VERHAAAILFSLRAAAARRPSPVCADGPELYRSGVSGHVTRVYRATFPHPTFLVQTIPDTGSVSETIVPSFGDRHI